MAQPKPTRNNNRNAVPAEVETFLLVATAIVTRTLRDTATAPEANTALALPSVQAQQIELAEAA